MNEPFALIGPDPANAATHRLISVRGKTYSVFLGGEQDTANDIATNAQQ